MRNSLYGQPYFRRSNSRDYQCGAAGKDSRLYPFKSVADEHLLSLYDRSMACEHLQILVDAGILDSFVVAGGENSGRFQS
jgi:dTDP-glucose pyrophosphorylase